MWISFYGHGTGRKGGYQHDGYVWGVAGNCPGIAPTSGGYLLRYRHRMMLWSHQKDDTLRQLKQPNLHRAHPLLLDISPFRLENYCDGILYDPLNSKNSFSQGLRLKSFLESISWKSGLNLRSYAYRIILKKDIKAIIENSRDSLCTNNGKK